MPVARLVRAQFLSLREKEFVEAARGLGAPPDAPGRAPHPAQRGRARSSWPAPSTWPPPSSRSRRCPSSGWASRPTSRPGAASSSTPRTTSTSPRTGPSSPAPPSSSTVLSINYIGDGLRDALDPRKVLRLEVGPGYRLRRGGRRVTLTARGEPPCPTVTLLCPRHRAPAASTARGRRPRSRSCRRCSRASTRSIRALNAYVTLARESALAGARKATAALGRRARARRRCTACRCRSRT